MKEHERIWLQPAVDADPYEGRQWCQDKIWSDGIEYVRADLALSASPAVVEPWRLDMALDGYETVMDGSHEAILRFSSEDEFLFFIDAISKGRIMSAIEPAGVGVELDGGETAAKLELWFFRSMFESNRLALFSLFGFKPADMDTMAKQQRVFRSILAALATTEGSDNG